MIIYVAKTSFKLLLYWFDVNSVEAERILRKFIVRNSQDCKCFELSGSLN